MNRHDKSIVALAVNALAITTQNNSDFMITSNRIAFDAPVIAKNETYGKKGKKGKFLKDWD